MRFGRKNRMKRSEYERVFRDGNRYNSGPFTFIVLRKQIEPHKLGIVVSRKVASGVARNKLRRRILEIIRRIDGFCPDMWIAVITRSGSAKLEYTDIERHIENAFRKIDSEKRSAKD